MTLEVEGSNPSTYPIWKVRIPVKTEHNHKFLWLCHITRLLTTSFYAHYSSTTTRGASGLLLLPRYWKLLASSLPTKRATRRNPIYYNTITDDFNPATADRALDHNTNYSQDGPPRIRVPKFDRRRADVQLFCTFLKVNVNVGPRIFAPHPSFYFFFIRNAKGGAVVANMAKLFTRWKDIYHLFFNLNYYKVELLTFGTPFFKDEVLAANWRILVKWKFMWKFTRTYFYLQPTKITNHGDFVFSQLRLSGLNVAVVFDTPYHLKTLYYLHRRGFYSIGPVPINYSSDLVDFAVPTGVNSIFTQLFFLRFMFQIRHSVVKESFYKLSSTWESVVNSNNRYINVRR